MSTKPTDTSSRAGGSTDEFGPTRRAVLAAGGAVALGGLAGCSGLDGLVDRAGEQVLGTTASAPAAFYAGRTSPVVSTSSASDRAGRDEPRVFRTGPTAVRHVPATIRAESREIELEGWSISGVTKAQDYNSSRSNKPSTEWWVGPDDDADDDADDDDDGDTLAAIHEIELALLSRVTTAREAVERRETADATRALDGFVTLTTRALRPELDKCGTGVCETVREHSDGRVAGVRAARDAVDEANWDEAAAELAGVEEVVLGDVERLDDELVERRPGRPRFIDIIRYLRGEPTVGERFTVCLPDAGLPGDLGSLAEELTPSRVLAYFAASHEPDGKRAPFHDRYGSNGISYDDEGCIRLDGPASLHRDISCGTLLSAELDTYRTVNRGIVGYSTDGGAVVSGASSASADTDGKCVFVAADGTLREAASLNDGDVYCWGQRRAAADGEGTLYCWGQRRAADTVSVSPTLVCPVAVTPADCPCPLPGLFYVRRILHDDQVVFAGGWTLDEGALYEDSATLLFDEGPTEVASVTPDDVESDEYDDRVVEQFSRDRSRHGSAVVSARVQGTDMNKAELIEAMASRAFQTDEGRNGLNAVNVKVIGERGDGFHDPDDDGDGVPVNASVTALDAPLVHLADASGTGNDVKFKAGAELSKAVN
ncbi:hypothetical protein [Halorubrum sp. DTA46]|uniref:hypothetical protein n=1 Tax=Halorubrum sp. DTA46 TaxID=3402162 RepID=UPI003AAAFBFB